MIFSIYRYQDLAWKQDSKQGRIALMSDLTLFFVLYAVYKIFFMHSTNNLA